MINNNELLFVVTNNNRALKPLPRSLTHKKGLWHRTTGIWIVNDKKQILCQKRSMQKDVKPCFWEAFFGGHLLENDSYIDNAVTELQEELGITIHKSELKFYKTLRSDKPNHKEFQAVYLYKTSRHDTNFTYEKEEIEQLQWVNLHKIKTLLITHPDPFWVHKPWDSELISWIEKRL